MKEFLVKKTIYDSKKDMALFANPGDYVVLMPDNHTLVYTNKDITRTMLMPNIEEWTKGGYITETFNTKNNTVQTSVPERARQNMVDHPSHYSWLKEKCGVEPNDIMRYFGSNIGQVLKYCMRAGHKSEMGMTDREKQIEDLEKALFYLKDEIKLLKES